MVDTLAPKRVFTQRELDRSLTPSPVAAAAMQPDKNVMGMVPDQKMPADLIGQQSDFLINPDIVMAGMQENQAPGTTEREQTIRSSEEITADKQTGERAGRQTTQGLAARPGNPAPVSAGIMYASTGAQDVQIDRPLVVGERGPEMIVPTGKNKFTVLSTDDLKGLMARVDLGPKLTDDEEMQQRENYFNLGRDNFLSLDQYLGSSQAFSDAQD
jgi:hypothetical protein